MVRQHVNPLSRFFQLPLRLPQPAELFSDPGLPLHLDIGCARGRFLLAMAQQDPARNHLGVEIRRPLVAAAEADRTALGLGNLHYLFCNANVSLQDWLAELPAGLLERVSIQFPDPWFKKKHHKRRVLQPQLLLAIAAADGGPERSQWLLQPARRRCQTLAGHQPPAGAHRAGNLCVGPGPAGVSGALRTQRCPLASPGRPGAMAGSRR
jgi:hypothetical protein